MPYVYNFDIADIYVENNQLYRHNCYMLFNYELRDKRKNLPENRPLDYLGQVTLFVLN